ncbi:MAG: ribosome small subunit-dependent GTPase A [Rhodothermales bacterium]|nr:ribosome small subunit-dependent GTPase A [Rhodothermales bacterium]
MPASDDAPTRPPAELRDGLVIRSTGSWYDVRADGGETVQARVRGKFRLEDRDVTNPVAVGDRVTMRMEADGTGLITELHDRTNKLSRRAAGRRAGREHVIVANVDRAWCVQASKLPAFNPGFVDRFLVMAEAYGVPAGLLLNKADLIQSEEHAEDMAYWQGLYGGLGYPVLLTSAEDGTGLDDFRKALRDRISVVAGPSGVGKSSLLNAVDPDLALRTAAVSEKTRKGRHTTTFAELHEVAGGWVVDTPGIREFGIWDMEPAELSGYYVDMQPYLGECRFQPCTHDHEPGCAVKEAVELDEIAPERYLSYLNILESLREGDTGR